jgi:hypothetical protein
MCVSAFALLLTRQLASLQSPQGAALGRAPASLTPPPSPNGNRSACSLRFFFFLLFLSHTFTANTFDARYPCTHGLHARRCICKPCGRTLARPHSRLPRRSLRSRYTTPFVALPPLPSRSALSLSSLASPQLLVFFSLSFFSSLSLLLENCSSRLSVLFAAPSLRDARLHLVSSPSSFRRHITDTTTAINTTITTTPHTSARAPCALSSPARPRTPARRRCAPCLPSAASDARGNAGWGKRGRGGGEGQTLVHGRTASCLSCALTLGRRVRGHDHVLSDHYSDAAHITLL